MNEDYYTAEIAKDPNTSPEILKKILEQGNDDEVSWNAVSNLNCYASDLEMILKRGKDDWVSGLSANNPNCPVELLEMVLKRGNNDRVSDYASENPNCPLKSKINWMQAIGIIGKEDPTKHIIESDTKIHQEDLGLQKLRELIHE